MSRDLPADAGLLCDKAAVLGDTIKGHHCLYVGSRCEMYDHVSLSSLLDLTRAVCRNLERIVAQR